MVDIPSVKANTFATSASARLKLLGLWIESKNAIVDDTYNHAWAASNISDPLDVSSRAAVRIDHVPSIAVIKEPEADALITEQSVDPRTGNSYAADVVP